MPPSASSRARALAAGLDAVDLLGQAHAALQGARADLPGPAAEVAGRLAMQVEFVLEVAELLCHEVQRPPRL